MQVSQYKSLTVTCSVKAVKSDGIGKPVIDNSVGVTCVVFLERISSEFYYIIQTTFIYAVINWCTVYFFCLFHFNVLLLFAFFGGLQFWHQTCK